LALLAVTTETLLGIATPTTAPPPAPEALVGGAELEEQAPSTSVTTASAAPSQMFLIDNLPPE
jgi:hypothetical protein